MKRREFLRHSSWAATGATLAAMLVPLRLAGAATPNADPFYANAFTDLEGRHVNVSQYLGKPLIMNFWATWCAPCVKEMPDLDALHSRYKDMNFVGLAVDTPVNVEKFIKKVQVSYPLLIGGHGAIQLMRALGNKQGGLPFTVVFDANGHIVERVLGAIKPVEFEQRLKHLI
ncbi:TlpA family protein disulfide reductase [Candidimonas sp. SYP-B2681]|nr:TlpA family protein disulfide reductase [Candidimonas sp. SYP-B2681]